MEQNANRIAQAFTTKAERTLLPFKMPNPIQEYQETKVKCMHLTLLLKLKHVASSGACMKHGQNGHVGISCESTFAM